MFYFIEILVFKYTLEVLRHDTGNKTFNQPPLFSPPIKKPIFTHFFLCQADDEKETAEAHVNGTFVMQDMQEQNGHVNRSFSTNTPV